MTSVGSNLCALTCSLLLVVACPPLCGQQASTAEAIAQIDQFWSKKLTPCGDSLAIRYVAGDWKLLKGGKWTAEQQTLNQADILNGIQWRGITRLTAGQSRVWLPSGGWQRWEQGTSFGEYSVRVMKSNGRWTLLPDSYSAINQMIAPRCSDIPKEPTAENIQAATDARSQKLCQEALSQSVINGTRAYLSIARDPNECRDAEGRTLLMLGLIWIGYDSDGSVAAMMQSGADLNVKDNKGWSALRYAVEQYRKLQQKGLREPVQKYSNWIRELIVRGAETEGLVDAQGTVLVAQSPPLNSTVGASPESSITLKTYQGAGFEISFPADWHVKETSPGMTYYFEADERLRSTPSMLGMIAGKFGTQITSLRTATDRFVELLIANTGTNRRHEEDLEVSGRQWYSVMLDGTSALPGEGQTDWVVASQHPPGLFYIIFVAPKSSFEGRRSQFTRVLESVRLR